MALLIGVLGGSQNRRLTGALKPVRKPDSFGLRWRHWRSPGSDSRSYPVEKIDWVRRPKAGPGLLSTFNQRYL